MPQPPKTDNHWFAGDQLWNRGLRPDGPAYVVPADRLSAPAITTDMYWYNEHGVMIRAVFADCVREGET